MRLSTTRSLFAASILVLATNACKQQPAPSPAVGGGSPFQAVTETSGTDVLELVRRLNRDFRVPSKWRSGHAKPRGFEATAIRRTDRGYTIQMPSRAPVPTPTVHDGKLYVGGGFRSKQFYCFDAVTGKLIWGVDVDDDGPSSAVVADGVVVFNTESCTIFGLDAATGEQLWSWWLGDPLMTTPTILDGRVYTSYPVQSYRQSSSRQAGASHAMACFELRTGKVLWQKWIDGDIVSAPVAHGGEILATTFPGTIYRFDAKDGRIRFAKQIRATSAPVMAGGQLFCTLRTDKDNTALESIVTMRGNASHKSVFYKKAPYLDATVQETSELYEEATLNDAANGFATAPDSAVMAASNLGQARVSSLQAFQGSRVLHFGGHNFNTMGDEVLCTDPASGKTIWKRKLAGDMAKLGGFLGTSPAIAGGDLFICTVKGNVLQLARGSGEVKATHAIGSPVRFQPAISDGRIYVGTQDGKVVCVDTGNRKLTGWSTWGGNAQHNGK